MTSMHFAALILSSNSMGLKLGRDSFIRGSSVILFSISLHESRDKGFIRTSPVVKIPVEGSSKCQIRKKKKISLLFVIPYFLTSLPLGKFFQDRTRLTKDSIKKNPPTFKDPILLTAFSLKNVRALEVQWPLRTENNLSPSSTQSYCVCLSPAWGRDWRSPIAEWDVTYSTKALGTTCEAPLDTRNLWGNGDPRSRSMKGRFLKTSVWTE